MTDIEQMRAMRENGSSDREIAATFNVSDQYVRQKLTTHPQKTMVTPVTGQQVASALRAWRKRHNLTEMAAAKRLHLASTTTLSRWEFSGGCSLPGLVLDYLEMYDILRFLTAIYDNGSLLINETVAFDAANYIDKTMQEAKTLIDI